MKRKILKLEKGVLSEEEKEVKEKKPGPAEREKFLGSLSYALELGFSISLPIVFGAIFGSYLDKVFASAPFLTLLFLFLGIIIGMRSIFSLNSLSF